MSVSILYPFTTPSNYDFDSDLIEVTGGVAQLKWQDTSPFPFDNTFDNDTGFTYDAGKVEFISGKAQQIETSPGVYEESVVTLPAFVYTGFGSISRYLTAGGSEFGAVRWIVNGYYWDGDEWVVSDDSYAQANDMTTLNAHITTAPTDNNTIIKLVFGASGSMAWVSQFGVYYNGQIMPITDPTIEGNAPFVNDGLDGFAETATIPGSDAIKYILKKGLLWYYWTGSIWDVSNETYAQANTAAEIETNKASFNSTQAITLFRAFLHSDDGSTTPELDLLTILYDFSGTEEEINRCLVWADNNLNSTDSTAPFSVSLVKDAVKYKTTTILRKETIAVTPAANGVWEVTLIETDNMDNLGMYLFDFGDVQYTAQIPDLALVSFWDLPGLTRIEQ